jgi:hypothetical protein
VASLVRAIQADDLNDRRVMDTSMIPRNCVQQYRLVCSTKKAAGRKTGGLKVAGTLRVP